MYIYFITLSYSLQHINLLYIEIQTEAYTIYLAGLNPSPVL